LLPPAGAAPQTAFAKVEQVPASIEKQNDGI
jgi:hypothetical protein